MSRYTLTTLQSKTVMDVVKTYPNTTTTRQQIEAAADTIINQLKTDFPAQFPFTIIGPLYAFTLSQVAKKAMLNGDISITDGLSMIATIKQQNEIERNDYGAFGDLFEMLVRIALLKNMNLINGYMVIVRKAGAADIVSKKFGTLEVAHNGKTWSQATLYNYMAGDFTGVVYGVFSQEDKEAIYSLCINKNPLKAIEYVSEYSVLWIDKYQFLADMNSISRGQGITLKGENVQCQYNESKYNAFLRAIESGRLESLKETLARA